MRKQTIKNILLVNPWIYDFAAYDQWSRPLGLLKIARALMSSGYAVKLLDCLDRFNSGLKDYVRELPRSDRYGCGKFTKESIEKPEVLRGIERKYYRYGIPKNLFADAILQMPRPDIIFMSSGMTFWYPGVIEAVSIFKRMWPAVPVVLGGIYASLCREHAEIKSGADLVFSGNNLREFYSLIEEKYGMLVKLTEDYPIPAVELLSQQKSLAVQTSLGCPFSCTYCASNKIFNSVFQRPVEDVLRELKWYHDTYQTSDIAFYDDALLYRTKSHIQPILKAVIKEGWNFRFHTPNALHARWIDEETAVLMKKSGFETIRLGLESSDSSVQEKTGQKVSCLQFKTAVKNLITNGFSRGKIAAYILAGMPGQSLSSLRSDVEFVVQECGVAAVLASYSPIQGTVLWKELVSKQMIKEDEDPLWQNNSVFFIRGSGWKMQDMLELRRWTREQNRSIGAENLIS